MKLIKKFRLKRVIENTNAGSVLNDTCFEMNRIKYIPILLIILFVVNGCNNYDLPEIVNINPPITNGQSLNNTSKIKLEGVYKVMKGNEIFGDTLIFKWSKGDNLSIFGDKIGLYAVTKGVKKDSSIYVYGYWRYALNSETGAVNLQLNPKDLYIYVHNTCKCIELFRFLHTKHACYLQDFLNKSLRSSLIYLNICVRTICNKNSPT